MVLVANAAAGAPVGAVSGAASGRRCISSWGPGPGIGCPGCCWARANVWAAQPADATTDRKITGNMMARLMVRSSWIGYDRLLSCAGGAMVSVGQGDSPLSTSFAKKQLMCPSWRKGTGRIQADENKVKVGDCSGARDRA